MSVRGPVYVSPLPGGADGVAEALCVTPHPPQTTAGEQALHRKLHGDPDREMDELPVPRESGEQLCGACKLKVAQWVEYRKKHCADLRIHFLVWLPETNVEMVLCCGFIKSLFHIHLTL